MVKYKKGGGGKNIFFQLNSTIFYSSFFFFQWKKLIRVEMEGGVGRGVQAKKGNIKMNWTDRSYEWPCYSG